VVTPELCHCGKPLHYTSEIVRAYMEELVKESGTHVPVWAGGRTWLVQRHYIALHGIKAVELPSLGFEEVTGKCSSMPS
jgi:hypothetical protein